jgi:hypothetical protein
VPAEEADRDGISSKDGPGVPEALAEEAWHRPGWAVAAVSAEHSILPVRNVLHIKHGGPSTPGPRNIGGLLG